MAIYVAAQATAPFWMPARCLPCLLFCFRFSLLLPAVKRRHKILHQLQDPLSSKDPGLRWD